MVNPEMPQEDRQVKQSKGNQDGGSQVSFTKSKAKEQFTDSDICTAFVATKASSSPDSALVSLSTPKHLPHTFGLKSISWKAIS